MVSSAGRGTDYIPMEEFSQNPFCSSKCNFSIFFFFFFVWKQKLCWLSTCLFICLSPNPYLSNCQICWPGSTTFHKDAEASKVIAFINVLWKAVGEERSEAQIRGPTEGLNGVNSMSVNSVVNCSAWLAAGKILYTKFGSCLNARPQSIRGQLVQGLDWVWKGYSSF